VGDVIRFRQNGIDVIHRVVEVQGSGPGLVFTTRGDNNNTDDGPVSLDRYLGKVILTVPKIGWVGILFRQALGWIGARL